jgi:hypothetical protein
MRSPIVAVALVSALAFSSGAFAQTTREPTQPSPLATPQGTLDRLGASILNGLWSPIRISLVRVALYSRTVALLALAAPHATRSRLRLIQRTRPPLLIKNITCSAHVWCPQYAGGRC